MIERKYKREARIGIFGVVHATYYAQFEGLKEKLEGYHAALCAKVGAMEVSVVDFGIVGSSEEAYATLEKMKGASLDLVFCNMVTYATSSVFAPIMRDIGLPVVLVALQPRAALDYTRASTFMQLENDNICSVPEFTGVAIRMGKPVSDVIIGTLENDAEADAALAEWCDIARVLHALRGARIGLMGHVLESMYDMHTDPTAVSAAFGLHVPLLEIDDVVRLYKTVTDEEVAEKSARILA